MEALGWMLEDFDKGEGKCRAPLFLFLLFVLG